MIPDINDQTCAVIATSSCFFSAQKIIAPLAVRGCHEKIPAGPLFLYRLSHRIWSVNEWRLNGYSQLSLAHLPLPLWRSTTTLSVTHHPVSGISFPRNFACLLIMKTYHSHPISHTLVRHFLHHHCHHPLLPLSSTTGSTIIFSTNPFLHSSCNFPSTGLTPWLQLFFVLFFSVMSVLTLAFCARLSWLLVSF